VTEVELFVATLGASRPSILVFAAIVPGIGSSAPDADNDRARGAVVVPELKGPVGDDVEIGKHRLQRNEPTSESDAGHLAGNLVRYGPKLPRVRSRQPTKESPVHIGLSLGPGELAAAGSSEVMP
jgi:hypothetical protein